MRKFTVARVGGTDGFAAFDAKGNQVTIEFEHEWQAHCYGAQWANAPSLQKRLKLRRRDGVLSGRPFAGVTVNACYKQASGEWIALVTVDGTDIRYVHDTMKGCLQLIAKHGRDIKKTRNILNPDAGEIDIARSEWGSCTDPGTERYHCM